MKCMAKLIHLTNCKMADGTTDLLNTDSTLNSYSRMMLPVIQKVADAFDGGDGLCNKSSNDNDDDVDIFDDTSAASRSGFSAPLPQRQPGGANLMIVMSSASWSAVSTLFSIK